MLTAAEKYREAIVLYKTTDLTLGEISRRCGVTRSALAAYIYRSRRDLMLKRNGLDTDPHKAIHRSKGQRPETRRKYLEAIEACDDERYIDLNLSQIARLFHLPETGLANQLRTHYPDIIPRREAERWKRGMADNVHRGARESSIETYSEAVELLKSTDLTIEEVADECNVTYSGLRDHLLYYHKKLLDLREKKRESGKATPTIGTMSGNGKIRGASADNMDKYADAIELYRTTSLSVKEIAKRTGVNPDSLKYHLRMWHRDLMFERRGSSPPRDSSDRPSFDGTRRYSRATREKYAEAIKLLKTSDLSTESVAKKFGFTPEVFRSYIKEHEPELFESLGMITLPNGHAVLKRSYDRYSEAIEAYSTTDESLRSIAARLNLPYNSIGGFIRRNMPELIQCHEKIVADASALKENEKNLSRQEAIRTEQEEEKKRIFQTLEQVEGNRTACAKLLGMSKTTLYKKLKSYGLQ